MTNHSRNQTFGVSRLVKGIIVAACALASSYLSAQEFSEDSYEVYFGDFNGDGKSGDVYFHAKDKFVLIFGSISVPLFIANDGSYVVYEGSTAPVSLKKSKASLSDFTQGTLGSDYYFTDVDSDGLIDVVAVPSSGGSQSLTLLAGGAGTPVVQINEMAPENIELPGAPVMASANLVDEQEIVESDMLTPFGGTFRVDESGAATYSIPIDVPEGTAGVAPTLSLDYSSSGPIGVAGKGWSLSGVGSIIRCRRTLFEDGESLPITWGIADRFCLNGQRLVVVEGTYGANDSRYQAQINSSVIVTLKTDASGRPDYFIVKGKDGSVSTFGGIGEHTSELAAYSGTSKQPDKIIAWALNEFRDSVGNKIVYTYQDDFGDHTLESISYAYGSGETAHAQVTFEYDRDRSDAGHSYLAGYEMVTKSLLSNIIIQNDTGSGLAEIRKYVLNYHDQQDYPNDTLSRLESIQLCGSGVCYDNVAIDFEWGSGSAGVNNSADYTKSLNHIFTGTNGWPDDNYVLDYATPDINGDGRLDLVWLLVRYQSGTYHHYLIASLAEGTPYLLDNFTASKVSTKRFAVLDYNADGRSDLYYNGKLFLSIPEGSDWKLKEKTSISLLNMDDAIFVDMDGDGLQDNIKRSPAGIMIRSLAVDASQDTSSDTYYSYNNTSTFQFNMDEIGNSEDWHVMPDSMTIGDYNGDGLNDVAVLVREVTRWSSYTIPNATADRVNEYDYKEHIVVFIRADHEYKYYSHRQIGSATKKVVTENQTVIDVPATFKLQQSADINGDGISDLVYSDNLLTEWNYIINTGLTFGDPQNLMSSVVDYYRFVQPNWIDLNYDGYADVAWQYLGSRILYRLWNPQLQQYEDAKLYLPSQNKWTGFQFIADHNGDSRLDYIWLNTDNNEIKIYNGYGASDRGDLIYGITDALENKTELTYGPLTQKTGVGDEVVSHYTSLEASTIGTETQTECPTYTAPDGVSTYVQCHTYEIATNVGDFYDALNNPFKSILDDSTELTLNPGKFGAILELAGPAFVVTGVESEAPVKDNPHAKVAISYHYHHLRAQIGGAGSLGFAALETVNHQTGIVTTTTYRQDWPFIGLPQTTVNLSKEGKILSESYNKYTLHENNLINQNFTAANQLGAIRYWTKEAGNIQYALSDNGATQGDITSTVVTTAENDVYQSAPGIAYGNVTHMEVTTYAGDTSSSVAKRMITENQYLETGDGLFYGRLISSEVNTSRPGATYSTPDITRKAEFSYYGMGNSDCAVDIDGSQNQLQGLLCKETAEGKIVTRHYYDVYGNETYSLTRDNSTIPAVERYSQFTEYDPVGRYPTAHYSIFDRLAGTTSPAGSKFGEDSQGSVFKVSRVVERNNFGGASLTQTYTGERWVSSRQYYSSYGSLYFSSSDTGAYTISLLSDSTENCQSLARFSSRSISAGGGESRACFDSMGKQVRSLNLSFDDNEKWIFVDTEYDILGRVVRKSEPYFSNETTQYWTEFRNYDLRDRHTEIVHPFFITDDAGREKVGNYAISYVVYDDEARKITYTSPAVDVNGKEDGITKKEYYNVLGEIVRVVEREPDENGAYTDIESRFEYDVFGNLTKLYHPNNQYTQMTYNFKGQKTQMVDPDKGTWHYTYNGFGDLLCQENANGQFTLNQYDFNGRMIVRSDYTGDLNGDGKPDTSAECQNPGAMESQANWYFDTALNGIGQLSSEASPNYSKSYLYDGLGRASSSSVTIAEYLFQGESTQSSMVVYDEYGRVHQQYDFAREGSDFSHTAIQNEYNDNGYLYQIRNADNNAKNGSDVYYQISEMNSRGKVTRAVYSGGISAEAIYNPRSGLVEQLKATKNAGLTYIQFLEMKWDSLGNLASRTDLANNVDGTGRNQIESYQYDIRNRLSMYSVNGNTEIKLDFDALGNLQNKSDVGNYDYLGAGLHAVNTITGNNGSTTFSYDNNGNMTGDSRGRSFEYAVFDKVTKVEKGSRQTLFEYDGDRKRFRRVDLNSDVTSSNTKSITLYLGNVEKVFNSDFSQQWKRTIGGVLQITNNFVFGNFQGIERIHLHKDHLGSITAITDEAGELKYTMSFDPWGSRRDPGNWQQAALDSISDIYASSLAESEAFFKQNKPETSRGFTGHEMVDEMGIVHMNGRIYDPVLGRFLQADPFIQSPKSIGSLNRYSYLMNNPLNAVDPSGFIGRYVRRALANGRDGFLGGTAAVTALTFGPMAAGFYAGSEAASYSARPIFKELAKHPKLAAIVQIVATAVSGVACGPCAIAVAGQYSKDLTYAQTGDKWLAYRQGGKSAAVAAAFYGIGQAYSNNYFGPRASLSAKASKVLLHGIVGGIQAEAQGGEFRNGFAAAGMSATVAVNGGYGEAGTITSQGVIVSALVGGAASMMTGGKFVNGAVTGAFSYILNSGLSQPEQKAAVIKKILDKLPAADAERAMSVMKAYGALLDNMKSALALRDLVDQMSPSERYLFGSIIGASVGDPSGSPIVDASNYNQINIEISRMYIKSGIPLAAATGKSIQNLLYAGPAKARVMSLFSPSRGDELTKLFDELTAELIKENSSER